MSTVRLKENPALHDHMLRQERLVLPVHITHNATPANKSAASLASVAYVRAQGQTATVDAIETLTWTAPSDSGGVFGLYLAIGKTVTPSLGPVPTAEDYASAVLQARVTSPSGATVSAVTGPNATTGVNCFLTPLGNIAIEITTSANLATTDLDIVVEVDYLEQIK